MPNRILGNNGEAASSVSVSVLLTVGGAITAATNTTPITLTTTTAHCLQVGDTVNIAGIVGNTAANGNNWYVSATPSATTYTIANSVGNGAWVSGGATTLQLPGIWTTGLASSSAITAATNATPVVYTTAAAHGLAAGQTVRVVGAIGNAGANFTGVVSATGLTTTSFALTGSVGTGVWSSGGNAIIQGGVAFAPGAAAQTVPPPGP